MGSNHESSAWQEVKEKEETEIQPQSGPQVSANGSTLLKLHTPGIPIRPVRNNKNAPSYKIAKKLNDILKRPLFLDNHYITSNSISLANDLVKLKINIKHRVLTLDLKDLKVKIPIKETIEVTRVQFLKQW
jgi:hypothetical protein